MSMLSNYLKIAVRKLNRHRSYTLINTVSLSMGIAGAVLVFAVVKYHLFFDGFHAGKDRIYRVYTELHGDKLTFNTGVPHPLGDAFRSGCNVAEKVARIAFLSKRVVTVSSSEKFEEDVAFADPDFFDIFNFPLQQGNAHALLQDRHTALVTQYIAQKYFGRGDPVGKLLRIDDSLVVKIAGVLRDLPPNTDFRSQIYIPFNSLQEHSPWMVEKDWWMSVNKEMQCFVRLKPGVTAASVDHKVLAAISDTYYDKKMAAYFRFKLQPLADVHFNPDLRGKVDKKNLITFIIIGLFLVLTACVNFVNLATAQALGRSRETGVRKALGSRWYGVFWQFITETSVIAIAAMIIGLGVSYATLPLVNKWFNLQLSLHLFTDYYLFVFLAGLLVTVIFLSGTYPGWVLARLRPILALKGKFITQPSGGLSLRKVLVVGQFAISQLLIIGTLIITNQLRYTRQADMGFRKEAMVILPVPDNKKPDINRLTAELSAIPDIGKVTFFDTPPASETVGGTRIQFDTRPEAEDFSISIKSTDDQYLDAFNILLLAGRNLAPSDTIREYLLNESAVKALGIAVMDDVLGKVANINGRPGTVVGVTKDFHFHSFRRAIEPLCITTDRERYGSCGVSVNVAHMGASLAALEKSWTKVYPASIFTPRFLDEEIERFYEQDDMLLRFIQLFAGIAIFVGCLGLYGLVLFMTAQKTKEIGVRKVLGASTQGILWLFGKEFIYLLLIAFALAAPVAWWVMKGWLNDFVYRANTGAGVFLLAMLVTFTVALLTVGMQSVKAALANPVKALRAD